MSNYSPTPVNQLNGSTLVLRLEIPGRLPSWNAILAMHHWKRAKFKKQLAADFMSALQRSAADYSTKTTSAKNMFVIYVGTLEHYQMTIQNKRKLKLANKKSKKASQSALPSKFGG